MGHGGLKEAKKERGDIMPAGTSYLFKEGMLSDSICKKADEEGRAYYEIGVKNQFLHAVHPIGWFKKLEVEIDGKEVAQENIWFVIRGQWFAAEKMYTISEVFWNLMEEAQICIYLPELLKTGTHHVKCTFIMSMLEDTQVLDMENKWPRRVEFVEGELKLEEMV